MTLEIYGLNTCPACTKARKALDAAGRAYSFRDIRAEPLSDAELATLLAEFGDNLVDKSTNDYRALSDWLKHSEAEEQLKAQPKLMARPVIKDGDTWHLGWSQDVQSALI